MNPLVFFLLSFTVIMGTLMTLMSNHWLTAWMGLELNTLAIIPLMTKNHHPRTTEAATKYFLIQAIASATILLASIFNTWTTGQWNIYYMTHPTASVMVYSALCLKLGLAPLHTWLPEILQGLNLMTGMILSTWQKLAPMALIVQIPNNHPNILLTVGMVSMLVGGWGGMNQTQTRKLLAYSSIAHMGWIIVALSLLPSLSHLALLLYIIMTTSTFLGLAHIQATNISHLSLSWIKTPILTCLILLALITLGGLPPLSGFMPKWLIISEMTKQGMLPLTLLAAMSSLLSLFFYTRLAFITTLTISPNNTPLSISWRTTHTNFNMLLSPLLASSIFLIPLTPLLLYAFMP
uniref:NADH-ubiquinone oxidoreductase chain 2 n=1 Tax=Batrachomoeus trispinosus TaxID=262770 RepID=Q5GM98_9TELE|nr:NADH dehydrogenase subunit 2 [Batrachomoeus trispinosus]